MSDEWDYDDFHNEEIYQKAAAAVVDTSTLTVDQYQEAATRTLLERPEKPIVDGDMMIIWNAIGICGEAGEIAQLIMDKPSLKDKIADELGDEVWYVAAIATKLSLSLSRIVEKADREPFPYTSLETLALRLCIHSGNLADLCKKGIFHRHGLDARRVEDELVNIMTMVVGIAAEYRLALRGKIMVGNLKKLDLRYKEKFTTAESWGRIEYKEGSNDAIT